MQRAKRDGGMPQRLGTPTERHQSCPRAVSVLNVRATLCAEHGVGLTGLYNLVDDGAFESLRNLHRSLDLAVIAAFGWEPDVLDNLRTRNRRLYDLNAAIVAGKRPYRPPWAGDATAT